MKKILLLLNGGKDSNLLKTGKYIGKVNMSDLNQDEITRFMLIINSFGYNIDPLEIDNRSKIYLQIDLGYRHGYCEKVFLQREEQEFKLYNINYYLTSALTKINQN